jgi:hypothetical protein
MIYISTPSRKLSPEQQRENIKKVTDQLLRIGLLVIDPQKLGIPGSWTMDEQLAKRVEVIREKATAIFLQSDWMESPDAKLEFLAVGEFNRGKKSDRRIQIYFEDFHGMSDIEMDVRCNILSSKISA